MKKPILVVMAAGMGSRYGGLKQIDPVGPSGEIIIDYSLYDAKRAGFEKAVCVIKREIEEDFKAHMARGAADALEIEYAFQDIRDLPPGFAVPEGRVKPWGTAHAVLAARELVDAPFAVINCDDYYGPEAFRLLFDRLSRAGEGEPYDFCMAAYRIENTLSEHGSVARGVCEAEGGYLCAIHERLGIARREDGRIFSGDIEIPEGSPVSMNLFGFTKDFIGELAERFPARLERILAEDPLKGEYFLPTVVSDLIAEEAASVEVLTCGERWYGVTYREDKPAVQAALRAKCEEGLYPYSLWG